MRTVQYRMAFPAAALALLTTGFAGSPLLASGTAGAGQGAAAGSTPVSVNWEQQQPAHSPPPRMLTAGQMAYDAQDQTSVFFGGEQSLNGDLPDDTWTYAGDWSTPSPTVHPDARLDSPMAYDPISKQVVLFGGTADYLSFGKRDTWTWDGSSWQLQHPQAAPLPRDHPGMAWDPVNHRILLYGGFELDNGLWLTDTWSWDGSTWTELHPAHHPPAGWGNYMATADGKIIDYTIADYFTSAEHSETWEWTGDDWVQLQTAHSPPPLVATSVAGDASDFVLFGGCTRVGSVCPSSTWVLHGGDWLEVGASGPSDRMGAGFVSTGPGQFLLYGGRRLLPGNPVLGDTWKLTVADGDAASSSAGARLSGQRSTETSTYSMQAVRDAMPGAQAGEQHRGLRPAGVQQLMPRAQSGDTQAADEFFGGNLVTVKGKKTSLTYTMVVPRLTCDHPRTFQITGQAGLLASATHRVGVVVREICDDTVPEFQYYEFADGGSVKLPFPVAAGDRLRVSVVSNADAVTIDTTNRTQGWSTSGVYAIDRSGLDHAMLGDIGYVSGSAHPEPVPVPDFAGQRFEQVLINGAAPPAGETTEVAMVPTYGGPTQITSAPWQGSSFGPSWNYF